MRPDAASNTVASGADASCTTATAVAAGESGRAPRGRMALLEKTLVEENDVRAALLREEHNIRIRLLQEDHQSILQERQQKKTFQEKVQALELQRQENELKKQQLEIEILELERDIKAEQLRRTREGHK